MPHLNANVAPLVTEHLSLLEDLEYRHGVLDLACGAGRNGLFLAEHHIPVIFADNNEAVLQEVSNALSKLGAAGSKSSTWLVDFELANNSALEDKQFDAILVFNYLHRALMPEIRSAVAPGGLLFYETFTESQRKFGRPTNPDFLLKENELQSRFEDWDVLHYFEGEMSTGAGARKAAASLIARKPAN